MELTLKIFSDNFKKDKKELIELLEQTSGNIIDLAGLIFRLFGGRGR
jgi:hypothetical protein